ncbi:hypothetical protein G9A89_018001, partial [Geosiphon pyriformis]
IKYCEETYPVQSQYTIDFESETETSNKGKNKLKQYSRTIPNTPTLLKTTAKHLQTPEQGTSSKLPLTITPFSASLAQAQTPNSPLNRFVRPEDFTSLRSSTKQQESLQTSSNLLDFLAENQSEHSETAANEENNSEITEEESIDSENKEDKMTTYIAKIPKFNGEDIETSPQEWLDQVTKAGDANGWNAARMLRTIPYFFKGTFTDNNTSITLCNRFRNIKQEPSESVMTYIGKFNKLLRWIRQLETNDYYSNAQILNQFITGLKDKLIKKVRPHAPEDLNSAIQHVKRYEMAIEKANRTKLVNLTIGETSSAAEEKIDQLTKKVENYFTNQQQQLQRYQPPQRRNQNNFAPLSNNQPQNCHYCGISGHWKRDCRKLQRDQQNRTYYPPRPQYQNNYYQPAPQPIQQQYQQPPTQYYQVPARRLITQNQFTPQNRYQVNNSRIRINVRGGIIDAGYTGDITVMLQNETDKPFKIKHAEKIAQAIYLTLINISGLQLVNQKEQLGKSDRGTQGFGSTGRFTVPVNIALNTQNESHQIFRLPQPITISPFGEHLEIYTCTKPTTTQQIFESNEQVCLEHNILIPNIYIPEGTKKVRVTFYNPNNYPIILLNNLEIRVIHSNIFQQELSQTVPDFSEIIGHSLLKINPNPSSENYHVVMEKLSRINMGQLELQQQTQLKELIAEFADIFAKNNNDLGRTDLVQHQIYIGDAKPRRQQAYQVAPESHQFI